MPGGNDANTILLLHCNGDDASTTFTDSSASARTITPNGNAQIDTAQSKFGGASGLFDGTGDYLTASDSADWAFGTNAFTIDLWLRFTSVSHYQYIISQGDGTSGWSLYWRSADSKLFFNTDVQGISCAWSPSINTWYHVALVRIDSGNSSSSWRIFIEGTSKTLSLNYGAWNGSIGNYSGPLYIGRERNQINNVFDGWLDEIRVSNIARWTTNFTPETEEYSLPYATLDISDTVLLSDSYNLQTNPDTADTFDTLSLSDFYDLITTYEPLTLPPDTLTLEDSYNLQVNPDNQSISDTIFLNDGWSALVNPETQLIGDTVNLSDNYSFLKRFFKIINTDLHWKKLYTNGIKSILSWILAKKIDTKLTWLKTNKSLISTDCRWLSVPYTELTPINYTDIQIFINGVDIFLGNDVNLQSGNINHTIGNTSSATFVLARRHDDLDKTHLGVASQITNQNPVQIYIDGHLEFDGYVSSISVDSESENVSVTVKMEQPDDNRHTIELPLPSINEQIHLYHCLVNNVSIDNPKEDTRAVIIGNNGKYWNGSNWAYFIEDALLFATDQLAQDYINTYIDNSVNKIFESKQPSVTSREKNPQYYKGIKVNLGIRIQQQVDKYRALEYIIDGKGIYATQIENGTFNTKPNYSYFWQVLAKNAITGLYNADYRYIGTSLGSLSTDLWVLNGVVPMYQKIKDNLETELGYYYIGAAPYKEISPNNGQLIPVEKWQDRDDGLYNTQDKSYNFTPYAQIIANLEYQKLLNVGGTILPITSANIDITFDAYYYYIIKLLTRINVTNTTVSNTYKNLNGFPVSVKSININFSNMKITLNCDNRLSQVEIDEIEAQKPDEDSYIVNESAVRVYRKFDLKTWAYVS